MPTQTVGFADLIGNMPDRWRLFRHRAGQVGRFPAWAYVLLFALAQVIDQWSSGAHGAAAYWVSGGVLVAALLNLHRRPAMAVLAACITINLLNIVIHGGADAFLWLGAVNDTGQAVLAAILARRFCGAALDMRRPRRLINFALFATLPVSILGASAQIGFAGLLAGQVSSADLFNAVFFSIAHLLGVLLVAPILLLLAHGHRFGRIERERRPEAIGLMALTTVSAVLVFWQDQVPLMFFAFPPMLLLALRLPPTAAGVALIVLAAVSGVATMSGHGPVPLLMNMDIPGTDALSPAQQRLSVYNLFLMSMVCTILPISAVASAQRELEGRLRARNQLTREAKLKAEGALCALKAERTSNASKEAFFRKLIEIMPAFLVVKNARDGSFVLINPAAENALGIDPSACIGKTAADIFPPEEAEASAAEDRLVIESGRASVDVAAPITVASGEQKYYTTKKVAVYDDDGPVYVVTAGQDVTEQVEAQNELREAVKAAERANAAKSQFLANMSHELRTPLNGIIAMADLLLGAQADDRSRQMAETIVTSGRMLEHVVNDILDVAKIEAGQMTLESEPFDLDSVLAGICDLHSAAANAKDIGLELFIHPEASGVYLGDKTRIGQIVSNLLSNAVKFTEQGAVRVLVGQSRGGLRVCVSDTGPGFDRATASRLFDRFEQADVSVSRRHGGTGLGLSICKSFAEMMGGRISVRSVPGKGSLFVVTLPLTRVQEPAVRHGRAEPVAIVDQVAASNMRILFADDHEVNRRVVSMILEPLGVDLIVVENGQLAVDAASISAFDLILMDVQMPVMDGLSATMRIREMELQRGLARTPIISLTANAMPDDVKRSLDAGSDLHLTKPIRPANLLNAVAQLTARTTGGHEITDAA